MGSDNMILESTQLEKALVANTAMFQHVFLLMSCESLFSGQSVDRSIEVWEMVVLVVVTLGLQTQVEMEPAMIITSFYK